MKKIFYVITIFVIVNIYADSFNQDEPFNALCVTTKSTGFNWKNGDWVATNFKPSTKYLVQKLKIEEADFLGFDKNKKQVKSGSCFSEMQKKHILPNSPIHYGCYNIRPMGTPFFTMNSRLCTEYPAKDGRGKEYIYISCQIGLVEQRFDFSPNGLFITANTSSIEENPKDGYKDSLAIDVGKCSKL